MSSHRDAQHQVDNLRYISIRDIAFHGAYPLIYTRAKLRLSQECSSTRIFSRVRWDDVKKKLEIVFVVRTTKGRGGVVCSALLRGY